METDAFACPRCGATTTANYYGPCAHCRDQLRAVASGPAREVEVEAYEPKMHVTPNHVATKD
jgi:hypothetical protein